MGGEGPRRLHPLRSLNGYLAGNIVRSSLLQPVLLIIDEPTIDGHIVVHVPRRCRGEAGPIRRDSARTCIRLRHDRGHGSLNGIAVQSRTVGTGVGARRGSAGPATIGVPIGGIAGQLKPDFIKASVPRAFSEERRFGDEDSTEVRPCFGLARRRLIPQEVGDRDRRQNADDRNHDHQLNERKTLLPFKRLHDLSSLVNKSAACHCRGTIVSLPLWFQHVPCHFNGNSPQATVLYDIEPLHVSTAHTNLNADRLFSDFCSEGAKIGTLRMSDTAGQRKDWQQV